MKNKVIIVITFIVLIFIVFSFLNPDQETTNTENSADSSSIQEESVQLTLSEVALHNTSQDCWLVIENNVYDVSEFISSHPGGSVIIQGCGTDATDLFNDKAAYGDPHSPQAYEMLDDYLLGELSE